MSQVVAPRWLTNTWRASFFCNSCRIWFIKIIEREWNGKPSGFYRRLFLFFELYIFVFLCLYIVNVIVDKYEFAVDYFRNDGPME